MRFPRFVSLILCISIAYFAYSAVSSAAGELPESLPIKTLVRGLGKTTVPASSYQVPVFDQDFPDPYVMEVDGFYYGFATNTSGDNIRTIRSTDMVDWQILPDSLPVLGSWVRPVPNQVWAPEVVKLEGSFRMYYVARDRISNKQCIGVATSKTPAGPYQDTSDQPLICPDGFQRAIDPNVYGAGDDLYIYYSGVWRNEPNGIYVQRLSADGLKTASPPSLLIKVDSPWEGSVVEAPTMLKHDDKYILFYSGNDYRDQTYAVGYALCKTPMGPCTKARENPILSTGSAAGRASGPGHQSILQVGKDYWIFYHAWNGPIGYDQGGRRALWMRPLTWQGSKPVVGAGTNTRG